MLVAWGITEDGQRMLVLGIPWLRSMMHPNSEGLLEVSGPGSGGHAILARGHEVRDFRHGLEHVVVLRNSWGGGWGDNGDCYIRVGDLARLLKGGGEACVPLGTAGDRITHAWV